MRYFVQESTRVWYLLKMRTNGFFGGIEKDREGVALNLTATD